MDCPLLMGRHVCILGDCQRLHNVREEMSHAGRPNETFASLLAVVMVVISVRPLDFHAVAAAKVPLHLVFKEFHEDSLFFECLEMRVFPKSWLLDGSLVYANLN
ncbi:unnamed protein product [Enterobius vermicularis]|uniref:Secreted protein n=1 Tax=Enterobius vermicularis TaxID=51028 RepID=A0A0N4UVI0_ENTVE|nr:unnamed protein product [Enterobius vermicularis]